MVDGLTIAAGIFMTNCFDMTESIYGESCAMYLALARLNHSCCPNVQVSELGYNYIIMQAKRLYPFV